MKETPQEKKIQKNLLPGEFTLEGFLGDDNRHFHDIVRSDRLILEKIDLTLDQIADKLEYFTNAAFESYDSSIIIDGKYEVAYKSYRGKLICPFAHSGVYRKGLIELKNLENEQILAWTPLNIHMIRAHGFFEGRGSKHRLEPDLIKKIIF